MQINPLLTKFENREKMIGVFFNSGTVVSAEILGGLGFDFIVIDTEHCQYDFVLSKRSLELRSAETWCRSFGSWIVPVIIS